MTASDTCTARYITACKAYTHEAAEMSPMGKRTSS